ncbi:polyprenyl synthetase family protein [Streptomyces sp. NPDC005805]|uniref:polyprenyl synthetase family protein n=1 Tax=Streptomyces sp. NPDC005805 TaxID=3157068 RepID=UPI003401B998
MTYLELHEKFAAAVERETQTALATLGPSGGPLRTAAEGLLRHQTFAHPLSVLPLLVHGAETGTAAPAVPLAALHDLWWTSACYLDDLADGNASLVQSGALGADEALLAAVVTGHVLPLRIVRSLPVAESLRGALADEVLACAAGAADGQLADLRGDAARSPRDAVVQVYRGKSGAPFAMITATAALLAGADGGRVGRWRELGAVFGVLWQLFNDQEDIRSGRHEDLANGTVTWLLARALDAASPAGAARIGELRRAARESEAARAELLGLLLAPDTLDRYAADLAAHRDEALDLLGGLGGDEEYVRVLRDLVEGSARLLL